ncbi:MAG TPA: FecR domain-containing protein, partial [Chloroflexota bacterium]|nr:FecR domain-containing protein [Chloroflexota bacterium]
MNTDMRRELEHLLSALCDGALTEVEHTRLEQLLGTDEACRRFYLEYVDMHARLLSHPGFAAGAAPLPAIAESITEAPAETTPAVIAAPRSGKGSQVLRYVAVAGATLAASLLVQFLWWHPHPVNDNRGQGAGGDPANVAAVEAVATLMQTSDCAWHGLREPLRDGARLEAGTLELHNGLARIRFDSGSELLVQGPAQLRLDGSDSATLLRGRLVFRSDVMAGPFGLHTPSATLVDLGTEYGVAVGPDGEQVHVFDGDVQRVPRTNAAGADTEYLQAGEACRAGPRSFPGRPIKCDPAL